MERKGCRRRAIGERRAAGKESPVSNAKDSRVAFLSAMNVRERKFLAFMRSRQRHAKRRRLLRRIVFGGSIASGQERASPRANVRGRKPRRRRERDAVVRWPEVPE